MQRRPTWVVRGRVTARSSCRLRCERLEDRTVPSVTAIEGPLDWDAGQLGAITILEPMPAIVAGQSPDSPSLRIDANTTSSIYAGVVGILIKSTQGNFLCSGTAISSTHILTAAHCLDIDNDGDSDEITGFDIYVNYGGSPSHIIAAQSNGWTIHPDYTGFNNPSINDDVGIIKLSQSLPAGVPIYSLYTGNIAGQTLELVGYGTTGTPAGYTSNSAGTTVKRSGKNVVGAFIGQDDAGRAAANEVWRADFDGPTSATNTLNDGLTLGNSVETTLGGGDSGGPAFINVGGTRYLAGVNTHTADVFYGFFQIARAPAYRSLLGGINVAPYADWINSVIGAPADTTPPAAPTGLAATPGNNQVSLDWANNGEADLAGYNVYRSTTSGSGFTKINASVVSGSGYLDLSAVNGTTYFYRVTALDSHGNESVASDEAFATPAGSGGSSPGVLYFTLQNDGNVGGQGGFTAANEDIIAFDGANYLLFFDGSAFGLGGPSGGFSTDAVEVFQNGATVEILMSFAQAGVISGTSLGTIYDADIVKFTVSQFNANGSVAAGTWSWFFDGSDVGLSSGLFNVNSAEGIDGIDVLSDGRLLISTHGDVSVPGVSAGDEDILIFTPTSLGATTAGSWGLFFDGSDVGLTEGSEDVDGFTVLANGGYTLYLSTVGNFATNGTSGTGGDVFVFHPTSLGTTTAGTFDSALFLDGSAQGLGSNNVLDVSFKKAYGLPTSTGSGSGRTSSPAEETLDAVATIPSVDFAAVAATPAVSQVVVNNIGRLPTFTQESQVARVNNVAALVPSTGYMASHDDYDYSSDAAPQADGEDDAATPADGVATQDAGAFGASAPLPIEAPPLVPDDSSPHGLLDTPLWRRLADAYFAHETSPGPHDGGEPAWVDSAVEQASLAALLVGAVAAPVRRERENKGVRTLFRASD